MNLIKGHPTSMEGFGHQELIYIQRNDDDPRKNICATRSVTKELVAISIQPRPSKGRADIPKTLILIRGEDISITCSDEFGGFVNCLLFIRDVTNTAFIRMGMSEIHASAVYDRNLGGITVILGNSNSGKTSTMLYFLSQGCQLVSNGRVYVQSESKELRIYGTPETIYLRPIYLSQYVELRDLVAQDTRGINDPNCLPTDKLQIAFAEICGRFGTSPYREGKLKRLVLANLSGAKSHSSVTGAFQDAVHPYSQIERRLWHGLIDIDITSFEKSRSLMIERLEQWAPQFDAKFINNHFTFELIK